MENHFVGFLGFRKCLSLLSGCYSGMHGLSACLRQLSGCWDAVVGTCNLAEESLLFPEGPVHAGRP